MRSGAMRRRCERAVSTASSSAVALLLVLGIVNGIAKQVTSGPGGKVLTNVGVWSPDGQWLVYDTRSDPAGEKFDGTTICVVNIQSGEVRQIYESRNGAHCGVATFHPLEPKAVFILGPENPGADWQYCAWHRQGVVVDIRNPGRTENLDARDIVPPFTPGALRGGSHVHVWDAAGDWISFTYEDHVLARLDAPSPQHDLNQRNIGVCVPRYPVSVPKRHERNHDGSCFTVLVTRTKASPRPGSDEIERACEEGWVGTNGYVRPDGSRQRRALAFQGQVLSASGKPHYEVFVVDLPQELTIPGSGPICGTETRMPSPPKGVGQRRLTRTDTRPFPGVQGPRHWLRSSPDGASIAFLMKDEAGVVQLWTISPNGGPPRQLTRNSESIASGFTWQPNGKTIAHVMDNSVCLTDAATGLTTRLTPRSANEDAPRPEACVFSPDGKRVAYVRNVATGDSRWNQLFVVEVPPAQ
jgi:hypothetical protein